MPAVKTRSVPAVDRALAILELLANSRAGLPLSEIGRRLGVAKSTAHTVLVTLERSGYLEHRSQRYVFGLKLFSLAHTAINKLQVCQAAAPFLHALSRATGLAVHMAVLENDEAVVVSKVEPVEPFGLATWAGMRMGVHCTAVGKALLAFLPDAQVQALLKSRRFPRYNENTIVSVRKLKQELERTKARGFSIDDEEGELGFRCVGFPVQDGAGNVVAAISLAAPAERLDFDKVPGLVSQLRETAGAISQSLVPVPESTSD